MSVDKLATVLRSTKDPDKIALAIDEHISERIKGLLPEPKAEPMSGEEYVARGNADQIFGQ
jgi:hypothetical protein